MKLSSPLFALVLLFSACGTPDSSLEDPEANPQDRPEAGVSDACGGKCDDPDAVINASRSRLLASLNVLQVEVVDPDDEELVTTWTIFNGTLLEVEDEAAPEDGFSLDAELYVLDEDAAEVVVATTLLFDGEVFATESLDLAELGEWQVLRVDVRGVHGEREISQGFEFATGLEVGDEVAIVPVDPWAHAKDVTLPVIQLDRDMEVPDYERATGVDAFNLSGTEFWQRWSGGHSPTFSYTAGTDLGRKCMYASARRFEAIMREAPESMLQLKADTNWGGSFFNWNDDYTDPSAYQRPRGAVLWAWKTHLIKWISQTGPDGSCFLPTLEQVERAAAACLATGERSDGAIEGCQAS